LHGLAVGTFNNLVRNNVLPYIAQDLLNEAAIAEKHNHPYLHPLILAVSLNSQTRITHGKTSTQQSIHSPL